MLFYTKKIFNQVMKGLMLGIVMFNIYINHLEMGVNNMLTKFADDTKLKVLLACIMTKWINDFKRVSVSKMTFYLKYQVNTIGISIFKKSHSMEARLPCCSERI